MGNIKISPNHIGSGSSAWCIKSILSGSIGSAEDCSVAIPRVALLMAPFLAF